MKSTELLQRRLLHLRIAGTHRESPAGVVAALGALQAQDFGGALWAVGLRADAATRADVERALEQRSIVRSWPLRGTLHFTAADDLAWLLDLLGARVMRRADKRHRDLGLDATVLRKVEKVIVRALEGGQQRTREELRTALQRARLSIEGPRLYHCLWQLALSQVLCFGTHEGKQPRFALLHEWLPKQRRLAPEAALVALTQRFFASHGPACARDLMRWAGLTAREVKQGLAGAQGLERVLVDDVEHFMPAPPHALRNASSTFLLPGFDEYMLGYADRSAMLDGAHAPKIVPGGNGVFRPTIVHDGRVVGTWSASATKRAVRIMPVGFETLTAKQWRGIERAAHHYGQFCALPVELAPRS